MFSHVQFRSIPINLSHNLPPCKLVQKIEELDAECGKLESSATDCKRKYEEIASKLKDEIGSRKRERDEFMEVIKSRDEQVPLSPQLSLLFQYHYYNHNHYTKVRRTGEEEQDTKQYYRKIERRSDLVRAAISQFFFVFFISCLV